MFVQAGSQTSTTFREERDMIRVWDKKVYDTTKAEEIAFYDAPIPVNDYNWYTETL